MPQEDAVTKPADVPEEAGVWPPQPTIAPPTIAPPPFRSLVLLGRWVVAGLAVEIGCDGLGVLSMSATAAPLGNPAVALMESLLSLTNWVVFLLWTYRAYKNLRAFGTLGLRFTPGWAVGYYFVPILGMYRPYQVFREIWRASDPAPAAREGQHWQSVRVPALLPIWWVSFLLSGIVSVLYASQPTPDGNVLSHILNVLNTILAILVVRRITAREERTAATLVGTGGNAG